jgi:hypothetical protein
MILLHQKYGQMANRIILISHFAATSLDTGVRVKIYNFNEYKDLFDLSYLNKLDKISIGKIPWINKIIISLIYRFLKKYKKIAFINLHEINEDHNVEFDIYDFVINNRGKLIIPEGWGFRNHEGIKRHANKIRAIFSPNETTLKMISQYKQKKSDILIAMHLRRGDYKEYLNGKYYYSFDEYLSLLKHIENLFTDFNHKIIIFSNEKTPSEIGLRKNVVIGPGQAINDFFLMSQCNYIIGPPSTFSLVASFLGQNKFYHVIDINKKPVISDFKLTESI